MTNYSAITRSNFFRVRDPNAFQLWCKKRDIDYETHNRNELGACFAISASDVTAGWPFYDADTDKDIDFYGELAPHLDERDVAVLLEVGFEGSRYLRGFARAIHADGRILYLDLCDIYERARLTFGKDVNITPDSLTTAAVCWKSRDAE
jgi:hypothetical protein